MEKENNDIKFLTLKFLEQGLSAKEQTELKSLLQIPENHDYFKNAYILWNISTGSQEETEYAWQKVLNQIDEESGSVSKQSNHKWIWLRLSAAAVFAFILGMSTYYFFSDNLNILLGKVVLQGGTENNEVMLMSSNCITVPLGSRSKIDLPDGTTVMLNAGSKLEYPVHYGTNGRNVKLEGEAYFSVAKNEVYPFIVSAKNTTIKALGTEFNVKAYIDEDVVQTTLVEGLVSINPDISKKNHVDEIILSPNQMLSIYDTNRIDIKNSNPQLNVKPLSRPGKSSINQEQAKDQITKEIVNTVLYTSWKDSRWIIEGEEMENLVLKLQRRYDVNFVIASPELKKYKFSGTFENETLEQVLDIVKTIAPINYFIDKKTVVLAINPEQKKAFEKSMN